jgi:hypothetical protein
VINPVTGQFSFLSLSLGKAGSLKCRGFIDATTSYACVQTLVLPELEDMMEFGGNYSNNGG